MSRVPASQQSYRPARHVCGFKNEYPIALVKRSALPFMFLQPESVYAYYKVRICILKYFKRLFKAGRNSCLKKNTVRFHSKKGRYITQQMYQEGKRYFLLIFVKNDMNSQKADFAKYRTNNTVTRFTKGDTASNVSARRMCTSANFRKAVGRSNATHDRALLNGWPTCMYKRHDERFQLNSVVLRSFPDSVQPCGQSVSSVES